MKTKILKLLWINFQKIPIKNRNLKEQMDWEIVMMQRLLLSNQKIIQQVIKDTYQRIQKMGNQEQLKVRWAIFLKLLKIIKIWSRVNRILKHLRNMIFLPGMLKTQNQTRMEKVMILLMRIKPINLFKLIRFQVKEQ